jgi:hypothetical protein
MDDLRVLACFYGNVVKHDRQRGIIVSDFQQAIDQIIIATKKLQIVCDGETSIGSWSDGEDAGRLSASAFCLKTAYHVWNDLRHPPSMMAVPIASGVLIGSGIPVSGIPVTFDSTGMRAKVAWQKTEMVMKLLDGLSPDEVDNIAKLYREVVEGERSKDEN